MVVLVIFTTDSHCLCSRSLDLLTPEKLFEFQGLYIEELILGAHFVIAKPIWYVYLF